MSEISRVALFGKLNPLLYKAVEGATVFCKLRGNPYVELVHWLAQILQTQDSDLHRIVRHFNLDQSKLKVFVTPSNNWEPGSDVTVRATYPYSINLLGVVVKSGTLSSKTTERVE